MDESYTARAADKGSEFITKLRRLKKEFRKWYGQVSVEELISNRELVFQISAIERLLGRHLTEENSK